jgi:tetratricopeptide (TPR) repeat protein
VYEAAAYLTEGRPREAQATLEPFAASWVEFGKRYAVNGERWVTELALARAMQGQGDDARAVLKRIGELPQQNYGQSVLDTLSHVADAAWIEMAAGDMASAARLLAGRAQTEPPQTFDAEYVHFATIAAEVSLRHDDPGGALDHAARALSHLREKADAHALPYLEARALKAHGDALLASGRSAEAITDLEPAVATMRRLQSPDSPWLIDALAALSIAKHEREPREARAIAADAQAIARRNKSLPAVFTTHLAEAQQLTR